MGGPTTSRNRIAVAFARFCGGSVLPSARLPACVHSCEVGWVVLSVAFRLGFYFTFRMCLGTSANVHLAEINSIFDFVFDSVWTRPSEEYVTNSLLIPGI